MSWRGYSFRVPDSLTILLVEDSATYALLAESILSAMGHTVTVATSAEAGLAMAESLAPALILMDIHLPGMDGYEAVRAMRQRPALRYTPVVAMTTTEPVNRKSIEAGLRAGFTGHTQKPTHEEGFRFVVETYGGTR